MRRLSNGMKVKIKSSKKEWGIYGKPWYAENDRSINNRVTKAYDERETCVVENAHIGKCDCNITNITQKVHLVVKHLLNILKN